MGELRFAARQIAPIAPVYVFVGLAFGILMAESGYGFLWTAASSAFIYAGSMQIILVPLLLAGAPLYTVALVTLFVNARHMFYGLGLLARFAPAGRLRRAYMALTVTDEIYSVLCACPEKPEGLDGLRCDFYILCSAHLLWIVASVAGALLGGALPVDLAGLEFSATAFFVVVAVEQWRGADSHIPAAVGLASAVAFYLLLGADNFILPALAASTAALLLLRRRAERRREARHG